MAKRGRYSKTKMGPRYDDNVPSTSKAARERIKKEKKDLFYEFNGFVKLEKTPIYGVAFNNCISKDQAVVAVAGSNRLTIFELPQDDHGGIQLRQCYEDPNADESYWTCAWSYDVKTDEPLVAVGGLKAIIRIIGITSQKCIKHFLGHGDSINDLKFHPVLPQILLSASKDHSVRLWNIATDVCVAIFSGVGGHRDQVLSVDIDEPGHRILSGSMDHAVMVWRIDKPDIRKTIEDSFKFDHRTATRSFCTFMEHYPDFSNRNIHNNYIDCVQWFNNNLVLSKTIDEMIVLWTSEGLHNIGGKGDNIPATEVHEFKFWDCDSWYIRFSFDPKNMTIAQGSLHGKLHVYTLNIDDLNDSVCHSLQNPKCKSVIRQTAFSKSGNILVCICEDGTLWRWNIKSN